MDSHHSAIRRAQPAEAQAITAMVVRSKAYWGYSDAFMRYAAAILTVTPQYIETRPTYVLVKEGALLGMCSLKELTPEEVDLDMLFVAPEAIGQGVGRQLVAYAMGVAAATGYRSLFIESDPNAAGFYEKMGGQLVGHRPVPSIPGRALPLYRIFLDGVARNVTDDTV